MVSKLTLKVKRVEGVARGVNGVEEVGYSGLKAGIPAVFGGGGVAVCDVLATKVGEVLCIVPENGSSNGECFVQRVAPEVMGQRKGDGGRVLRSSLHGCMR